MNSCTVTGWPIISASAAIRGSEVSSTVNTDSSVTPTDHDSYVDLAMTRAPGSGILPPAQRVSGR